LTLFYRNSFAFFYRTADLDNLVKFVLDALNAKAYEDDSQIAAIRSAKFYTEGEPYTKVIIRKLTDSDYENFVFE
jgi:Holliday junction resolvase RusA-like endonuclease